MKKIFRHIGFGLIVIGFISAAIKTILFYYPLDEIKDFLKNSVSQKNTPSVLPKQTTFLPAQIPDFQVLVTQKIGVATPTEAQIKEEKQVIAEQVITAGTWLSSADVQQRNDGAEQLSAYPSPEAEIMLIKALSDPEPTVRKASAESLAAFEKLSNQAITTLLAAMDDINENVQLSSLTTLESQAISEEKESFRYKMILQGLKKKAKSSGLSEDVRNAVSGFIDDQL